MSGHSDPLWNAFVAAMLEAGHVIEDRSRYGDKPALFLAGREIAHQEAPGVIDLRITGTGWTRAKSVYGKHPAVHRDPSRRDWLELRLADSADLTDLGELLAIAVTANS